MFKYHAFFNMEFVQSVYFQYVCVWFTSHIFSFPLGIFLESLTIQFLQQLKLIPYSLSLTIDQ